MVVKCVRMKHRTFQVLYAIFSYRKLLSIVCIPRKLLLRRLYHQHTSVNYDDTVIELRMHGWM